MVVAAACSTSASVTARPPVWVASASMSTPSACERWRAAGDTLTPESLGAAGSHGQRAEVWFCGPRGFGDQLKAGLARLWGRRLSFRREAFEMR